MTDIETKSYSCCLAVAAIILDGKSYCDFDIPRFRDYRSRGQENTLSTLPME